MKWPAELRVYWREGLLLALLVLPTAALPALGFVWLLERGLALVWLGAVLAVTGLALGLRAFWRARPHGIALPPAETALPTAEAEARAALALVLEDVRPADLDSTEALRALLERSVRAVAAAFHPDDPHAALRVTLPEVLLMTEQFAANLRGALVRELPILRRAELTLIPQGLSLTQTGGRLWSAWRVLRLANPLGALLQEARALLLNAAIARLTEAGKARAAAILVREVGGVAIDLYAGRFRKAAEELPQTAPKAAEAAPPGPVTVLLAGQGNAGKSALLNALSGEDRVVSSLHAASPGFTAYALKGEADLVLVDSPGIGPEPAAAWLTEADRADLIVWVARAHDIARGPDQRALAALRSRLAADPALRPTPVILALTHADRLPPPREWAPPYAVGGPGAKEQSLQAACDAARTALDIPVAVPVRVDDPAQAWNLDALRAAIAAALPEARRKQLERALAPEGWGRLALDTARGLPAFARRLGRMVRR